MRRMMHAIAVPFLFSTSVYAQESIVPSHEVPPPVSSVTTEPMHPGAPRDGFVTMGGTQAYSSPEFYSGVGEQPYSQLATYMSCQDGCKDFWAGYAAERASIAARLCKECNHGHCKTSAACNTACGPAACDVGCDGQISHNALARNSAVANRYKQDWATLHSNPAGSNSTSVGVQSVAVAKRNDQTQQRNTDNRSLLVTNQYASQSAMEKDRPVISPYLKGRNIPSTPSDVTALKPASNAPANAVHLQAPLPPSEGKWAR